MGEAVGGNAAGFNGNQTVATVEMYRYWCACNYGFGWWRSGRCRSRWAAVTSSLEPLAVDDVVADRELKEPGVRTAVAANACCPPATLRAHRMWNPEWFRLVPETRTWTR